MKLNSLVLYGLMALCTSCSSIQDNTDSNTSKENTALILVEDRIGFGPGARQTQVTSIDGIEVNHLYGYVRVTPACHTIHFNLVETIDPGQLSGPGNQLSETAGSEVSSTNLILVTEKLEPGRKYAIDTHSLYFKAAALSSDDGTHVTLQYTLVGRPALIEKK